jgi:hypothetical protein
MWKAAVDLMAVALSPSPSKLKLVFDMVILQTG